MNQQQAIELLDISQQASEEDIKAAYKTKNGLIENRILNAQTEALKLKFEAKSKELDEAYKLLLNSSELGEQELTTESNAIKSTGTSPLSHTKMADIPSAGANATEGLHLNAGQLLAGRYKIVEQIGEGGMGAVYRATDNNTSKDIALKIMQPALLNNDRARERFLDEARISQQLSHPNIINVYDVQQDGAYFFLTMELLEGQDLRQVIENRQLAHQPFAVDEVQEIIEAISAGLTYAHKYTVHRDIKPENIWLTEEGEYKLMDFGIAQVQSTSQRTKTGAAMGTAYYMAPEQLKGQKDIDGRADQYALAVLAYELLSGEVPAGMIEPVQQHRKDIPKGMAKAIHQALSPRPENRFVDIESFSQAIQSTGKGISLPSMPKKIPVYLPIVIVIVAILFINMGKGIETPFLSDIWDAIKPVDRELLAQQTAEAAKLQGEIKNYQRRLENGRRQLDSDVRDAKRNKSKNLKNLQHWQTLTNNYLFEGNQLTELEGEQSMGESYLRQEQTVKALTTLTAVRDGYKILWGKFNTAENLKSIEDGAHIAKTKWLKRKKVYDLEDPIEVSSALKKERAAIQLQRAGEFKDSKAQWDGAKQSWLQAYQTVSNKVASIDKAAKEKAAKEKANREQAAREKAKREKALRERVARDKEAEAQRLAAIKKLEQEKKDAYYEYTRALPFKDGNEQTFKNKYSNEKEYFYFDWNLEEIGVCRVKVYLSKRSVSYGHYGTDTSQNLWATIDFSNDVETVEYNNKDSVLIAFNKELFVTEQHVGDVRNKKARFKSTYFSFDVLRWPINTEDTGVTTQTNAERNNYKLLNKLKVIHNYCSNYYEK